MSHPADPSASDQPSEPASNWRGAGRATEGQASPGWQQGGTAQPLDQLQSQHQKRPLRVVGLLLLVFVLTALWVYSLLFRAVQTPLIVVAATDYEWPLPPNAWVREDIDRLQQLHNRTVDLVEVSADWSSGERALSNFEEQLSKAATQRSGASCMLIYISMHGVVDGDGNACLIPPGASPLDAGSWVRIRSLLDVIEKLPTQSSEQDKILILDCNRIQANWRLGVLYNSFAERLKKEVREAKVRNLIVLNSTSPGQVGWAEHELGGSAFGHFLHLGLAGKADADGDRRITVEELHAFVRDQVNSWAKINRAVSQEPMLIADSGVQEHAVVWVPAGGPALSAPAPNPKVRLAELNELWKGHDELLKLGMIRYAPVKFQAFRNHLLWLEQLNQAGRAYYKPAKELKAKLEGDLAALRQVRNVAANQKGVTPHSLPLASYFGRINAASAASISEQWQGIGPASSAAPVAEGTSTYTESVFLGHWHELTSDASGEPSDPLAAEAFSAVFESLRRGEQVAVPDDERVGVWIRGSVAQGDRARRAAEDALSAGDFVTAVEASGRAKQAYDSAAEFTALVTAAFELRDRGLSQLPYLSEWSLAERPLNGSADNSADENASAQLTRLINNLLRLGEQLSEPDLSFVYVTQDTVPFVETLRSVESDFEAVRGRFDMDIAFLEGQAPWKPAIHRRMLAVLATPLIPAKSRDTLLEKLRWKQIPTEPSVDVLSSYNYLNGVEKYWIPGHPAVQLLSTPLTENPRFATLVDHHAAEGDADNPVTTENIDGEDLSTVLALAREGERMRRILRELPTIYGHVDRADEVNLDAAWRSELALRSRQERLARCVAAWVVPADVDPVTNRQDFDLQNLLLWHAERTLQDFRGPTKPGGEPFFRVAAKDYLIDLASELGDIAPALAARRDSLQTQLDEANFSVDLQVENVLQVDPDSPVQTQLTLRPGNSRFTTESVTGRLALLVRSAGQPVAVELNASSDDTNPEAIDDVPSAFEIPFPVTDTRTLQLRLKHLGKHGPRLDVVAAFRGHELVTPWLVQPIGGVTVDYQVSTDQETTVLVKGNRRRRKSFVFVLDCSDSMKQTTDVEATDGQKIQRLDLAKSGLQGMLDQLADEPDTRVGVRFFGHRVGWSTTEPVRVLRRQDYIKRIPLDLAPSEDVELVLPLGRFDSLLAGRVEELFKSIKPWGQTPLYRSLIDAIGDFDDEDPDTEKHIIVITDGVNYQFTPSATGQFAAPQPASVDDIVRAWEKRKPAIHLVGFGIPKQDAAAAEREYRELIERTDGTFETSVAEAQVLLRKLDQLLEKATYEVLNTDGENAAVPIERDGSLVGQAGAARLGEALVIQPDPPGATSYTVVSQQARAPILLRGGEAAEFQLSADGRHLESAAYLAGSPRFGKLFVGGLAVGNQFGVHRPIIESNESSKSNDIRFEFSLQHPRRHFASRPAEIWIDVTPLDEDGTSITSAYTFYDGVYVEKVPVPLISWLAKGWPRQAGAARVDCWYKPQPTTPDETVDVNGDGTDILGSGVSESATGRLTFAAFPDVEFQLEFKSSAAGTEIWVVEWHGDRSAGVGSLKVDLAGLASANAKAARVIRTFDPQNRVAAHVFTLPANRSQADRWKIHLTKASTLRNGAIQLAKPITMKIAENAGQLAPLPSPTQPFKSDDKFELLPPLRGPDRR